MAVNVKLDLMVMVQLFVTILMNVIALPMYVVKMAYAKILLAVSNVAVQKVIKM